jgi:hypothetical protein
MRLLLARVCLLLLLVTAPAARPALADELVVDDSAPSVQFTGSWAQASTTAGFFGAGYHYRVAGDGSSSARWPFPGTADGTYELFARWTSGPNRASNATYTITHAGGTTNVSVDQRSNGGAWQSLGTFRFGPAPEQGVSLSDKADGVVIADAVRWVPSSGAPAAPAAPSAPAAAGADLRFFEPTQFRIDRDSFWDFFQKRGGLRTFGYPVSREFTFFGCQTQIFQRLAMQQCGDAGVGTLNVLEDGLLPYTRFNGSSVPAADPALIAAAPLPSDPAYASKAIDFVKANVPDTLDGEPVNFLSTFQSTVTLADAFPDGNGDPGLLPLLNLQLWGLPTSKPAVDPNDHEFIYQRFQRGIMHYDRGCHCTQGLLLADYLKSILTGDNLPADLAAQARGSRLLKQYDRGKPNSIARPADRRAPAARPGGSGGRQPPAARRAERTCAARDHLWRCLQGPGAGGAAARRRAIHPDLRQQPRLRHERLPVGPPRHHPA